MGYSNPFKTKEFQQGKVKINPHQKIVQGFKVHSLNNIKSKLYLKII